MSDPIEQAPASHWMITTSPVAPRRPRAHLPRVPRSGSVLFAQPEGWAAPRPLPAAAAAASGLRPPAGPVPRTLKPLLSVANGPGGVPGLPQHPAFWDLVFVVDTGLSMIAWLPTVDAFIRGCRNARHFADIHTVRLASQHAHGSETIFDRGAVEAAGLHLTDTARRRKVVFVITDGVGAAWATGALAPQLRSWGRHALAVIHLLPQQEWPRTSVKTVSAHISSNSGSNTDLELMPGGSPSDASSIPSGDHTIVPVLEMRQHWFEPWSRAMSPLSARQQVMFVPTQVKPPRFLPVPVNSPATAQTLVRSFRDSSSPYAFQLAVLLAHAPLNQHIMHLIQTELLPGSSPGDLSAVLTSGLLFAHHAPQHDSFYDITFDFQPDVRQNLLSASDQRQTRKVAGIVEDHLGKHVDAVRGLVSRIENPEVDATSKVTAESLGYLIVEHALLTALSGRHSEAARRLGDAIEQFRHPDAG